MMWLVYIKNEFNNALTWCQLWNEDRIWVDGQKQQPQILKKFAIPREEWTKPLDWLRNKYPYTGG